MSQLRGTLTRLKGCSLKLKINELKYEIKYAFQRAWNGYDDTDVFAFNDNFNSKMVNILKEFKVKSYGLWNLPPEYIESYRKLGISENYKLNCLSENQMNAVLDCMIFHFQMADEQFCEKQLYGNNIYDENYRRKTYDELIHIENVRKQNQDLALKLFVLFFNDLWD